MRIVTRRNDVAGSILEMYTRDKERDDEWKKINEMRGNLNFLQFMGYMIPI
jgi:hypothetical protein